MPDSVAQIDLGGVGLTGSIPAGWVLPPNLYQLVLMVNYLTGSIPGAFLANIPSSLTYIDVRYNNFIGPLPNVPTLTNNNQVWILPQHTNPSGFCAVGGKVPTTPIYWERDNNDDNGHQVTSMKAC